MHLQLRLVEEERDLHDDQQRQRGQVSVGQMVEKHPAQVDADVAVGTVLDDRDRREDRRHSCG